MKKLLLITLLLSPWILPSCSTEEPPPEEILRPVRYVVVVPSKAGRTRSFSGVAVSATETKLSFRVGGSLTSLRVKVGQQLKAGEVIAELDNRDLQLQLEEARAALLNARVQANTAKSNLTRIRELYENDNVSLSEYEQAKNSYAAASADLSARRKQFNLQKRQLQYSRLSSPVAGIITEVPVAINENVNAGEVVAVLSAGREIEVEASVPEAYIGEIETGKKVQVVFSALEERQFSGLVSKVGYTPSDYSTYTVTVRLDEPDAKMRPGMAADVRFAFAGPGDSLLKVPSSAVAQDQDGNFVYLLEKGEEENVGIIKRRAVTVGELTREGFVVTEGLEQGDRVVTAGISKITSGMRVRFTPASEAQ